MAFGFYRSITIDPTKCGASNSSSFPVLVSLTDATLKSVGNSGHVQNSNGYDIYFYSDSALTSRLPAEREIYTASTGAYIGWVNVTTVSHTVNTVIYIAYGDATISTDPNTDGTYGATSTWNAGYKGVWHLADGTTLNVNDSTSNAHNGTVQGTVTAAAGKIDGAESQNGAAANYITVGTNVHPASNAVTLSGWVKATTALGTDIINKNYDGSTVAYGLGGAQAAFPGISFFDGGWHNTGVTTNYSGDGNFHFVVGTYDGTILRYYFDGVADTTLSYTGTLSTTNTGQTAIGEYINNSEAFGGTIDEVRVSNVVRSADWITTEFNNQNTPGNIGSPGFYTVGAETTTSTVVFDAAATSTYEATLSSYNFNLTVANQSNRVLVVGVSIFASGTVTGITYNSIAMTFIRSDTNGVYRSELWGLIAPSTGLNAVAVTLSASLTSIANAQSYYNADQTAFDNNAGGNGTGTPASASITSVVDKCTVVGNLATQTASGVTSHAGQNSRTTSNGALGTGASDDFGDITPAGSKTLQWDNITVAQSWAISLVTIRPPQAAASTQHNLSLIGIGN